MDMDSDNIYTLRGPRQVGKTTLLKLIIRDLIREGVNPRRIFYWTCDLIEGPKALVDLVEGFLDFTRNFADERRYVFLDEISAVKDWQRGIKYLYDTGRLHNCTVILTGSHSLDIRRAAERLPGRRGTQAGSVDKVLLPMKFSEYVETKDEDVKHLVDRLDLKKQSTRRELIDDVAKGEIPRILDELSLYSNEILRHLENYLITGGILLAVNDYERHGVISQGTYHTYVQSTIGDIQRWGKSEVYLAQLLERLIETQSSQVSWRSLRKGTDIGHESTVSDYVDVLKSSFILCPLYVIDRSKGGPRYSSEKKIHFRDPFIFHALNSWVRQTPSYETAMNYLAGEGRAKLIESIICDHLIRLAYTYFPIDDFEPTRSLMYWKSKKNEVDFVLKYKSGYLPIEVKYGSSFSRRDINGVYSFTSFNSEYRGIVITRDLLSDDKGVMAIPAHIFLMII
ncbi:MAG: ATP-binding protein [Candidatus Bathyarchaeota archaeon]|nr:ATP-binding protein [Candidatus Bathyarchaeota archaeon]